MRKAEASGSGRKHQVRTLTIPVKVGAIEISETPSGILVSEPSFAQGVYGFSSTLMKYSDAQ